MTLRDGTNPPIRPERRIYFPLLQSHEEQFGVERTIYIICDNCKLPMKELVEMIHSAVVVHSGKAVQDDDMTIVLVKREQN